ncbi:MAG: efflux RND transporter periplasmic adaptor subunit, partial [Armatimonadetes bacterium]|nr:efflux RND transporter periplasmic adaptor subunit [Armatimonadota bacterium]
VQENIAALGATVAAAEADLQAARTQVKDLTLRSPLTGLVATRQAEPGAVVSPTTPLLSVQTVSRLWATVGVPEDTARRIAPGQSATVTLDAFPGERFTGRIERILPAADPQSRQFTVRVALDNSRSRLRPGTFARVSFVTQKATGVLTVPPEAVKEAKDEKFVLVAGADNTAQKRPVKTGLSDDKGVAVTGDLREAENVIILSQRDVKPGAKIRTANDKAKTATNNSKEIGK